MEPTASFISMASIECAGWLSLGHVDIVLPSRTVSHVVGISHKSQQQHHSETVDDVDKSVKFPTGVIIHLKCVYAPTSLLSSRLVQFSPAADYS